MNLNVQVDQTVASLAESSVQVGLTDGILVNLKASGWQTDNVFMVFFGVNILE